MGANIARTAGALAVGAVGGFAFFRLGLPLPWMLGALFATLAVVLAGGQVAVDMGLRRAVLPVMGVLIGSSFGPGVLDQIGRWPGGIAVVIAYVGLVSAIGYAYLRRVAGWDAATALYAAPPGGLSELVLLGGAAGGDERRMVLFHSIRVVVAVTGATLLARFTLGAGAAPATALPAAAHPAIGLIDAGVLIACAVGGGLAGSYLRLPGGGFMGALLLSAGVHLTGASAVAPPSWIVNSAQVLLGAGLGGRFVGLTRAEFVQVVRHALIWGAFLVGSAYGVGLAVAPALGLDPGGLFLALAPGGFTEMLLVTLSIGVAPAFVATCHTLRIVAIVTAVPLLGRLVLRGAGRTV